MQKTVAKNHSKIVLFQFDESGGDYCQLKNFLHYLKSKKVPPPIKFAYAGEKDSLIRNLSLKENILLDNVSATLPTTVPKEQQLKVLLEHASNRYLADLVSKIPSFDLLPEMIDEQICKIATLIKSFLQKADYLFLDHPGRFLSKENFKYCKSAIEYKAKYHGQIVLLHSDQYDTWVEEISEIVYRSQSGKFVEGLVPPELKSLTDNLDNLDNHLKFHNFGSNKHLFERDL